MVLSDSDSNNNSLKRPETPPSGSEGLFSTPPSSYKANNFAFVSPSKPVLSSKYISPSNSNNSPVSSGSSSHKDSPTNYWYSTLLRLLQLGRSIFFPWIVKPLLMVC